MIVLPSRRARMTSVPLLLRAGECVDDFGLYALSYGQRVGGVYARASVKRLLDRSGRQFVLPNDHLVPSLVEGELALLMEPTRTQICPQPQTPASWSLFAPATVTAGIVDPWGGSAAIRVTDDDATAREGVQIVTPFTGDGTKAVLFAVRPGTTSLIAFGVRDATAGGVDRVQILANFVSGPSVAPTLSLVSGSGNLFGSVRVLDRQGNVWWLIGYSVDGVIAANTNFIYAVAGTGSATVGDFFVAGANVWNAPVPASWQHASGHVRNADSLYFPFSAPPQAMTVYVRGVAAGLTANSGANRTLYHIGSATISADPRLRVYSTGSGSVFAEYDDGTSAVNAGAVWSPIPNSASRVEVRQVLLSTGATRAGLSVDGATETTSALSGTATLPGAWASPRFYLTGGLSAENSQFAYTHVVVSAGEQSLDAMRELAGV